MGVAAFCLLSSVRSAQAATYYVATTGNDSNSGTAADSAHAFATVAKGVSVAIAGDTVIVEDGTYGPNGAGNGSYPVTFHNSGTSGKPITVMAQNRGKATLDCQMTCSAYFDLYNASFIVIQGFNIWNGYDEGIHSDGTAHDITIKWNDIGYVANGRVITDQIGRDGIFLNSSEYNFTFDGNAIHDIGRASGAAINHLDHGIYSGAHNLTIINNIFYNNSKGWSIQLCGATESECNATTTNVLIANNTFALNNKVTGEPGDIIFWGQFSGITVENNIFYQPVGSPLSSYQPSVTGSTFDYNLVYGATVSGAPSGVAVGAHNLMGTTSAYNPNFSSLPAYNFHLTSPSPAIGAAVNLTNLGITQLDSDKAGASRPATGNWAIGAYQSGSTPLTFSPCDVNKDSVINVADVQLEVNLALGVSPCTNSSGTCTVVSVQRVFNAALGGACVAP